jgi:hypothetical protein
MVVQKNLRPVLAFGIDAGWVARLIKALRLEIAHLKFAIGFAKHGTIRCIAFLLYN